MHAFIITLRNSLQVFAIIFSVLFSEQLNAQCDPVADSLALVAIYHATNGANWVDNSNWLEEGLSIEDWDGVETNQDGCVTVLRILDFTAIGNFPPEIGTLTSLLNLTIFGTQLGGPIPPEIGNLVNLETLYLVANAFTGPLPPELGNLIQLRYAYLSSNRLQGSIPPELGNLVNLHLLELDNNQLSGGIPPELGNLSNLSNGLNLKNNQLSGNIPAELGNLSNLRSASFSDNQLNGSIPSELGNMSNLQMFEAEDNQLSGEIPSELGNTMLIHLLLRNNELSGSIPPELGNLPLSVLLLSNNQLTGNIPAELGNAPLFSLYLDHNQLNGTIPAELGAQASLTRLSLNHNELTGSIPAELGNTALQYLYLNNNKLIGSIPAELGNLTPLDELDFSHNQLSGSIPTELGNITIRSLDLSYNQLTGSIPPELGNVPYRWRLDLSHNQLTGNLPREFAIEPLTLYVDFSHNQLSGCYTEEYTALCPYPLIDFTENPGLPFEGDLRFFCAFGSCTGSPLVGQVILDENDNCVADSTEVGLVNWKVKADSEFGPLYAITDEEGYYKLYTNPGEYVLELIPPSGPYWANTCAETQTLIVEDLASADTLDFFPSAIVDCPSMTIDLLPSSLRRCFDNTYYVTYCNEGTVTAEDASIEIVLDELINVQSATIPISSQVGNTLFFELGDVAPSECEIFRIYVDLSCEAVLGQTICAAAHIFPDSLCIATSPEWSGAEVAVEGDCEGDLVKFTIKNIGDGNMQEPESYIVIEDGLILLSGPTPFTLNSQGEMEVDFPANGSTYICQANQVDNFPYPSRPTVYVEGCGTNDNGGFSTGYVTQFPEDDSAPFLSTDCREVIGAFDPNDKRGFPMGYGEEHYIDPGQDIEYQIRFQNTGTDTAFTVVIRDGLSPSLDIATLTLGASSHPYSLEILGADTLLFVFDDILLVDSFTNEPGSHGFVKFKISQKEGLPLGTRIENTAGIYFDFNEPVITNTTWHVLEENYVLLSTIDNIQLPDLQVSVMPNPMANRARFKLSGVDFKKAQLSLFSPLGQLMRTVEFTGNEVTLERGNLMPGMYLFEIWIDGRKGGIGKVIIQ